MKRIRVIVLTAFSALLPLLGLNATPTFTIQGGTLTAVELHGATVVDVPSGVTSIGDNVFMRLTSLRSVSIPNGVTSIGHNAFYGCTFLSEINIPDGVITIGDWAFKDCSSLMGISIPSSVTRIGGDAFSGCGFTYTGNYGYGYYGYFAGDYCSTTGSGTLNVRWTIRNGELTDVELNGETDVTIPSSVTSIGNNAFRCCYNLASVVIPDSVTSIGERTFEGCYGLKSVTIGNGVISIGREVFYNCSSLTNLTIGNSVTSIGYRAFYGCSGLTGVIIPPSVTTIGERAFDYCYGLTSITIGNGVRNIGNYAFLTCSSLTSVTIPAKVTSIGNGAFAECFSLTSVLFLGNLPDCGSDAFKAVAINVNVGHGCCVAYVDASEASLQDGDIWNNLTVRKIPLPRDAASFSRVTFTVKYGELTHVEPNGATLVMIPGSVTCIRHDAFDDCCDMTCVLIPNSVRTIEGGAFRDCHNLANIVMPTSVTRIEDAMFEGCDKLTSVVIPDSVTSIGSDVFSDCSSLTSVTIGKSVTSIGYRAFYGCSELTSVTIPDSMTCIGTDTFTACSSLTNVTIGNSVTCIEDAFRSCYSLRSIVIPNTVRLIWPSAFEGCSGLVSMLFLGDAPPSVGDFHTSSAGCKAYVKSTANGWPAEGEYWNGLEVVYYGGKSAKATIEESVNGYALAAYEGETLSEGDIAFTAMLDGTIVDTTSGYDMKITADGKSATARLKKPAFGAAVVAVDGRPSTPDGSDPTGALVVVDESELASIPVAMDDEEVGALPVAAVPGLYYQAAWGDNLDSLTTGTTVQATTDTLYLGVIKQMGTSGFYKVTVKEQ